MSPSVNKHQQDGVGERCDRAWLLLLPPVCLVCTIRKTDARRQHETSFFISTVVTQRQGREDASQWSLRHLRTRLNRCILGITELSSRERRSGSLYNVGQARAWPECARSLGREADSIISR